MDRPGDCIRLYSAQHREVVALLEREGVCYSQERFITQKYGESAPIFLTAYRWLAQAACGYVPRPPKAGLHYWAFAHRRDVEVSADSRLLVMDVPVEACILFDARDWDQILRLAYLGEDEDRKAFEEKCRASGLSHQSKAMLTAFYPDIKAEILSSWQRLFRHHEALKRGEHPIPAIQAALWEIQSAWITAVL